VDFGSGGILIVSFGDSVACINLRWVSFYLLGTYEETNNRYFTRLFNFDCMKSLWVFLEKLTGFSVNLDTTGRGPQCLNEWEVTTKYSPRHDRAC